jgi:hypothetical protein
MGRCNGVVPDHPGKHRAGTTSENLREEDRPDTAGLPHQNSDAQ